MCQEDGPSRLMQPAAKLGWFPRHALAGAIQVLSLVVGSIALISAYSLTDCAVCLFRAQPRQVTISQLSMNWWVLIDSVWQW